MLANREGIGWTKIIVWAEFRDEHGIGCDIVRRHKRRDCLRNKVLTIRRIEENQIVRRTGRGVQRVRPNDFANFFRFASRDIGVQGAKRVAVVFDKGGKNRTPGQSLQPIGAGAGKNIQNPGGLQEAWARPRGVEQNVEDGLPGPDIGGAGEETGGRV